MTGELPSSEVPVEIERASRTGPSPLRLAVCTCPLIVRSCARAFVPTEPSRVPLCTLLVFDAVFLELRIIQFSVHAAKGEKLLVRALLDDVAML